MAHQKIKELEDMAREMVGDGKSPNLYFVSQEGVILTVTRDPEAAYKHWKRLPKHVETELEDRNGTICSTEQGEISKRWQTWDNFDRFSREA